jgi:hypothetical protein
MKKSDKKFDFNENEKIYIKNPPWETNKNPKN